MLYTFNMQLFSVHSVTVLILTRVHYQDFVDFSLPLQLPVMRKGEWVAGDGMSSSDRHDTVLAHGALPSLRINSIGSGFQLGGGIYLTATLRHC